MRAILFSLFYGLTWLIAQIPLRAVARISDFTYLVIYHLIGYRRSVVRNNLKNSFPEKTDEERKTIEKKFYRHLSDLIFESVFLLHASRKRVLNLCKFNNLELFERFYKEGKSAILVSGHYGSWELYSLIGHHAKHHAVGIYKPLANARFEKLMNNSRKRFGGVPVAMKDTLRALIEYKRKGEPILLGLVSDQTPAKGDIRYWTTFLNQQTPVFLGVEKLSQKFNLPVVFCNMRKVKRGKYEVDFELLTEEPNSFKPYELTELHLKRLERQIIEAPEYWLWSHRRWKRKPKPNLQQTESE